MKGFLSFLQKIKEINKQKKSTYIWYVVPVVSLALFIASIFTYITFALVVDAQVIKTDPISFTPADYFPELSLPVLPDISAQSAIVMDNQTKTVIFAKNPNLRFSPASTTKIMTALIGLAHYNLSDVLTIHDLDPESVNVGFYAGEKFTFQELLYAMLLPSSNDAANAIAQNYPGGEGIFIRDMNDKAKSLHLYNTHFGDPVGLTDDLTYTTAFDLSKLASYALENTTFTQVVGTKQKTITDTQGRALTVTSLNKLLGYYGVNGIKTGYTEEAKEVLATSVFRNGHTFIIIVMKSEDRFADTLKLINTVVENTTYLSIHSQ